MVLQEISEDWIRVLTRPLEATFTFTLLTQCPVKKWHFDKSESKSYGVWAENKGCHPTTKVDFFQHSSRCPEDILPWGTNCPDFSRVSILGDILPWPAGRHFALTSWGTYCPGDILPWHFLANPDFKWLLGGTFCPDYQLLLVFPGIWPVFRCNVVLG